MQTRDQKLVSRFPNQNCKSNKPVAHIKCWSYGFVLTEEFWSWSRNLSQILSTLHHWLGRFFRTSRIAYSISD